MPDTCSCGATLAEDARFCHKCGRPVFETPVIEPEPVPELETAATPASAPRTLLTSSLPVSFSNPIALRVAFLMSLALMLVQMIPGVNLLFVLWWLAAGYGAVLLYRRITGAVLSVRAGARLGSITGVLSFLSMAIIFALTLLFMGKDFFSELAKQDPQISEVAGNPTAMAMVMLLGLALVFGVVVGTCAAGGALGARFGNRPPSNG
jgi:hypothetical protein